MNWTLDSVNEDNFFEFKSFFDLHVINKKIHIFGSTEKNSKETEIISNTKSFDHLGYYDTEEKKWKLNKTRNEESPIARKDYASALHYNAKEKKYFLFVHGGTFNAFKSDELYFQTFENGSIFLHDFYRYDFEQNQWTELDSVIVERRGHSAVVTKDNRMIFFGGRLEFENGELSNNLFIFNIVFQFQFSRNSRMGNNPVSMSKCS
eukprot:gb/GECH01009901.1/.p1 GENE.gb/GECH01009901.1/~~gb/GECH01009901.1/.p1  ORF type:complete len:206 (+),score=28.30 gb/GECH01009901.1/:1-618(+)